MSVLDVRDVHVSYGKIKALQGVSFSMEEGQIVSIIGSNGAGKSSLLKSISAIVTYTGTIEFKGKVLPQKADKVVKEGIVQVPEGRQIFSEFTVENNLLVGAYLNKDHKEVSKMIQEQYDLFPILGERRKQYGATLSGGEQQMLAIARALMSKPKLLLLDEPSLGLAPKIISTVYSIIQQIRDRGITILLVEQNAKKALSICDYAFVLENGIITNKGTGDELLHDDSIMEAYLGARKSD
jgi:branched-chain amino acid transport system ATP-binding protein